MISWKRLSPGNYKSEDGRFLIRKTWNRIYSDHWELLDKDEPDRYKGMYIEKTLLDCKLKAEKLEQKAN